MELVQKSGGKKGTGYGADVTITTGIGTDVFEKLKTC